MDGLFPTLPEDLSALSENDLNASLEEHRVALAKVKARDPEYLGELSADEIISQTEAGVEQIKALNAQLASVQDAQAAFTAKLEALAAEAEPEPDPEPEPEPEPEEEAALEVVDEETETDPVEETEEATEEVPEPVLASGRRYALPPEPAKDRQPVATAPKRTMLVATGSHPSIRIGEELDRTKLAFAMNDLARELGRPTHGPGGEEVRYKVASARLEYPPERTLGSDPKENAAKIAAACPFLYSEDNMGMKLATGGINAPPTPFYDIPTLSTAERFVPNAVVTFNAPRGGVSVPTPTTIADITTAITVVEEAEDAAGGTYATKACQTVAAVNFTDTFVGAIAHCREFGNLGSITWPEQVAHENDETMAGWARTADGRLLDQIDTLSLQPTVPVAAVYGASRSLLYRLATVRQGMISRLRMPLATRVNAILPFWAAEMFSLDITNGQFARFETPPERVAALLAAHGIDVYWHLDQGLVGYGSAPIHTRTVEIWPDEVSGTALDDWPGTTVVARVFVPGTFIRLDTGMLELGIVRDSTLNETNDYQIFGESFEAIARPGPAQAAMRIEMTVCPDGTYAPAGSAITCS